MTVGRVAKALKISDFQPGAVEPRDSEHAPRGQGDGGKTRNRPNENNAPTCRRQIGERRYETKHEDKESADPERGTQEVDYVECDRRRPSTGLGRGVRNQAEWHWQRNRQDKSDSGH